MAVQFTYDIGYMGVVKIGGNEQADSSMGGLSSATAVLATGGNINVEQTPIFSSGVWGAGWYNAAEQVAYAPNFITLSGSVSFELTSGSAFDKLQAFGFEDRANPNGFAFYVLPNGTAGYAGNAWCESMSFSASQDAIVTGDFGFKSGNVTNCINAPGPLVNNQGTVESWQTGVPYDQESIKLGASGGNLFAGADAGGTLDNFLDVFPFWASGVAVDSKSLDATEENIERPGEPDRLLPDVMDWNASYSSELVLSKLCTNLTSIKDSQEADYAAIGTMTADGSFTIFAVSQQLDPARIRNCRACKIQMGPASDPATKSALRFGAVIFQSGSTDIQTGSSFVQSSFNFSALGDGERPVMSLTKGETAIQN